jgi:hypothetical protein
VYKNSACGTLRDAYINGRNERHYPGTNLQSAPFCTGMSGMAERVESTAQPTGGKLVACSDASENKENIPPGNDGGSLPMQICHASALQIQYEEELADRMRHELESVQVRGGSSAVNQYALEADLIVSLDKWLRDVPGK